MNLQGRIELLSALGTYMLSDEKSWNEAKEKAGIQNKWFIPEFTDMACRRIAEQFLEPQKLEQWISSYDLPSTSPGKTVGIVMAGNIPLVGFHDFLSAFVTGHRMRIKASSKDDVLIRHLAELLISKAPELKDRIFFEDMLKGCDAYIATGSNNSSRYFEYYFGKFPNIIRRNRTSAALLDGTETKEELELLADDIFIYFGRGCRNVTRLFVPEQYDFIPLLRAFEKYNYLADHNQYKNNYDYNLALHILNNTVYMSTPAIILIENSSLFSPISQVHYTFYKNKKETETEIKKSEDLQCLVGHGSVPFGQAQMPSLSDFADGVDTIRFLASLE